MIKILIAEDFDIIRENLKEELEKDKDIEIVAMATNGKEAVSLALENEVDIILMDIEMETTYAGIKATEEIRDKKSNQKIIYLTIHENEDMIIKAMGTGAVDYILKDSSTELIIEHIKNAYIGKPIMQANIQNVLMKEYKRLQMSERSLLFFISNVSGLTRAERDLVKLLLDDKKVKEIAEIRHVEQITVKTQIKSLLRKFGCSRTKEIVSIIKDLNLYHLF